MLDRLAPANQALLSLPARSLWQMVQGTQSCLSVLILVGKTAQHWAYKHCPPEATIRVRHNASGTFVTLQLEQVRRVFVLGWGGG